MYVNTETMETYRNKQQIRYAFPNTGFPVDLTDEILASFSIMPVVETIPIYNELTEIVSQDTPEFANGVWTQVWNISDRYETVELRDAALTKYFAHLKAQKNEEINESRLAANQDTFMHLGERISCDQLSRGDIETTNGEIIGTGAMPAIWAGAWKTADNGWIPINTVEEWRAFYSSMYATGSINFAHAQDLKGIIASIEYTGDWADAVQRLNAVTW